MDTHSFSRTPTTSRPGRPGQAQAAPAGQRPISKGAPPGHQNDQERNKRLREVRAEVQDLQAALSNVSKGDVALNGLTDYIQGTRSDVAGLLDSIPGADPVRHVCNLWDQILASPLIQRPESEFETQTMLGHLTLVDDLCRKLILQVGIITIPERVNQWLDLERPGYYIPFHAVFEDELPSFEDRLKVLNYLAWAPNSIEGGLVDVESGLIYRYSKDKGKQQRSFWSLVLTLLATFGSIVILSNLPIQNWLLDQEHLAALLVGWAAVLTGVGVHIVIGTAKRAQAREGRPPIIAMGDLVLLIDARFGQIVFRMLLAMIGFLGLTFTAGPDNVTPFNAFLVGYSLDSVIDVFSTSLEQRAAIEVSDLKQRLGIEPEE